MSGELKQFTLGADDHVGMYLAQFNLAAQEFGPTGIHLRGRTDMDYPNMTGLYGMELIGYWHREIDKLLTTEGLVDNPVLKQWVNRAFRYLDLEKSWIAALLPLGKGLAPIEVSAEIWKETLDIVLPLRAIKETPATWEIAIESIKEAVKDLTKKSGLERLAKIALWILGGGVVVYAVDKIADRD